MMQGIFSLVVNSAALYISIYSSASEAQITDYLGTGLWIFGFLFEAIGDSQLKSFLKKQKSGGEKKFLQSGLWSVTRHPNYFGESGKLVFVFAFFQQLLIPTLSEEIRESLSV